MPILSTGQACSLRWQTSILHLEAHHPFHCSRGPPQGECTGHWEWQGRAHLEEVCMQGRYVRRAGRQLPHCGQQWCYAAARVVQQTAVLFQLPAQAHDCMQEQQTAETPQTIWCLALDLAVQGSALLSKLSGRVLALRKTRARTAFRRLSNLLLCTDMAEAGCHIHKAFIRLCWAHLSSPGISALPPG